LMSEEPEVSVILPAYRSAATLAGCLDSLVSQTFQDFEVIVIDSKSKILASVTAQTANQLKEKDLEILKKFDYRDKDGLLPLAKGIFQMARLPLRAPGHGEIGHLLLGYAVDSTLAQTIKEITHSEVCFFFNQMPAATTLDAARTAELARFPRPAGETEGIREMAVGGENFLVLRRNLKEDFVSEASIWYYLLKSEDKVVVPLMSQIFRSFFLPVLIGALATILGSFFLSKKISARLEKLVAGAHQISSGNLDFTLPASADDEIGRLSEAFDQMRISLKNRLAELKEAHAQAMREERLGIVGRMAATIIHDFRGPMQIIQGSAELLALPDAHAEKRERHSEIIIQQVERIANMTQELLDFAKGETRTRRVVLDIEDLLTEVNFQAEELCKNTLVRVDAELKNPFQLWADKEKILRVLLNLIRNAKEALEGGGEIKIFAFLDRVEGVIQVADNGPGIAPELAGRLFQPFATFGKPGGTGLGLALSKKIVEEHGGSIQCDSEPGKGTAFTIRLPAGERVALETMAYAETGKIAI
ncbi:MAG: ATP-binding protein, partial [candidate division Zixibacteria bacterium]|nr:ATP-binding protein [candidate division Zixibacteria bacterium]